MHHDKVSRSYLFIPVNRADFIAKAHLKNADVVILDLEDSIPYEQKESSRKLVNSAIEVLKDNNQQVAVRVNSTLEHLAADLSAIDLTKINSIVLPKAEDAAVIRFIEAYLKKLENKQGEATHSTALIPMIETCRGVLNMREIANASSRIIALALGSEDLANELGVQPTPENLVDTCRQMVLAAGEVDIKALGFPGSIAEFYDKDQLSLQFKLAKDLGFSGSFCVHPTQVNLANTILNYSDEQMAWAAKVIAAMDNAKQKGLGICQVDGHMIDEPVLMRAKKMMANC